MGPVDGPRKRGSKMLRIAAAGALAIVLVVVFASRLWRTNSAPTIETPPTDGAVEAVAPTTIDPIPAPQSRVSVGSPSPAAVAPADPPSAAAASSEKIRVVGEVRDPSGERILAMPATLRYGTDKSSRTCPITHGEFVIEGLDPGPLRLDCDVKGYRRVSIWTLLRRGVPEQRFDFVLSTLWTIDVVLRNSEGKDPMRQPDGELRLTPLHLRVSSDPPPEAWGEESALSRRALRLVRIEHEPWPPQGVYARVAVACDPPAYLSVDTAGYVLAATRVEAGVDRATLVVPMDTLLGLRSSFTCTVVDREGGSPIAGVRAIVCGNDLLGRALPLSDGTGRIRGKGLPCGHRMLMLESEGRSKVFRPLELRPGVETDLGAIPIDASLHVRGRFVDENGRAIRARESRELCHALAFLSCAADDPMNAADSEWISRIESRPDGTFEGEGFGRGCYLLMNRAFLVPAEKDVLRIRPMVVDFTRGSIDDLVVTMERVFRVTLRPDSDEAQDLEYSIVDANGVRVHRGDLGEARMEWLPTGSYVLEVGVDDDHVREIPFTVGSGPQVIPIEQ